jgi:hypothetical protein
LRWPSTARRVPSGHMTPESAGTVAQVSVGNLLAIVIEAKAYVSLSREAIEAAVREGRMNEAFAVRLLDALDDEATYIRAHDGTSLLNA